MNELREFVRSLRAAGVAAGTDRVAAAAAALAALPDDPYWALRVTLCARRSDVAIFDSVWHAWSARAAAPSGVVAATALAATEPTTSAPDAARPDDAGTEAGAGSHDELARRDIRHLTPAERAEIDLLIGLLAPAARRRPGARRLPARTGRVNPRRTVRLMLRTGGEPSRILRDRRSWRPRRLLLLIDISRSMSAYSDALLRFAHAAVAAGPATTEVFTLGTRWTRLTAELRGRDADAALRTVGAIESDWDGGTTLGPALRDFLRRWGGRTAVRSAIIVICSDGLEAGNLTELPRQMARLSRLGHTLIWVNPAQALPHYVPVNPALKESLRHVAEHVPGHTFESLRRLAEVISR